MYLVHLISIDLELSRLFNSLTLQAYKQSTLPSFYKTTIIIDLLSYGQQPITKYALAISISQGAISSLQVFKALFRILLSLSTILFKRRLIVLAISSAIISLLIYRRVTSVLPIILLRSARASQGKNLFIRISTFLLLLLVAYNFPILYRGSKYRFSTRSLTLFFTFFAIA